MKQIKYSRELLKDFETLTLDFGMFMSLNLIKNLGNMLKFFYEYLAYAGAILKKCRPDIFKERFTQLKDHYTQFYAKYLA